MIALQLALAGALAGVFSGRSGDNDLYRRVVARAVERVQTELHETAAPGFEVDHSRWEDPWVVVTEHYEVRTTHSYGQARNIADNLEYMRREYEKLLGAGRNAPAGKQRVWIFPTMAQYNQFNNDTNADVHSSIYGGCYASHVPEKPVLAYQNGNPTLLGMWVTHGAVHQFVEQNFGTQPVVWVAEGLASYFALFWDRPYGARQLERIERGGTFVPLERLREEPLETYRPNGDDRFIELGMLFHFLLDSCEATRNDAGSDPITGPFQEFLRATVRGQDVDGMEFAQTFEQEAVLLEQDFKAFRFAQD